MEPLIAPVLDFTCVLPHGFQIQSGYLACTLSCLHAVILKVTSGVTPAFSTNRGVHCISMYMAWRLVMFPTCHICNRGRLPGFDRETYHTVSRCALHSATMTGFYLPSLKTGLPHLLTKLWLEDGVPVLRPGCPIF